MNELVAALTALGYGALSAVFPPFNSEAYVAVIAATLSEPIAWLSVVALSVGATVGKVVIFVGARQGRRTFVAKGEPRERREPRTWFGRWSRRSAEVLLRWLGDPRLGPITVLVSAFVGIPPLLVVAALAGVSRVNLVLFATAVLVGRVARFAVIAWPLIGITG